MAENGGAKVSLVVGKIGNCRARACQEHGLLLG